MTDWFGKGCVWLAAQHEADDEDKKCTPVLVFCNHEGNTDTTEGNCCPAKCPLGLKQASLADALAGLPAAPAPVAVPAHIVDLCTRTYNHMIFSGRFDDVRCSEIKSRLAAVFGQEAVDEMLRKLGVTP